MIIPLRVSEDQEDVGLDISQHEEVMEEGVMPPAPPVLARIA
jgi:ammonia channel protein AmtB